MSSSTRAKQRCAVRSRWLLLLLVSCAFPVQAIDIAAQEILSASDAIRNPDKPFGLTVTLTEYRNGNRTEVTTLSVYSKADPGSGQFKTLVRFVSPPRDADKLMLKNANDLWFYDPSSKASIRLSPQQRLLGQAANGDVVTVNFGKDYEARLAGQEEVADGDRQMRRCRKL